jgi:hypothetical protein
VVIKPQFLFGKICFASSYKYAIFLEEFLDVGGGARASAQCGVRYHQIEFVLAA